MGDALKASAGPSSAQQLQDAVCDRLTKDGALDSIRRKVNEHVRNDESLNARLQQLIEERCRAADLTGLDAKPKAARRHKAEEIRAQIMAELREGAGALMWQLLADQASPLAHEAEVRVLEALCAVTEEQQRQWEAARRAERDAKRAAEREERRAAAAAAAAPRRPPPAQF